MILLSIEYILSLQQIRLWDIRSWPILVHSLVWFNSDDSYWSRYICHSMRKEVVQLKQINSISSHWKFTLIDVFNSLQRCSWSEKQWTMLWFSARHIFRWETHLWANSSWVYNLDLRTSQVFRRLLVNSWLEGSKRALVGFDFWSIGWWLKRVVKHCKCFVHYCCTCQSWYLVYHKVDCSCSG